jgi:hypothetical protein
MALRFRRRIKLAPGIHWNISGSGSSFSFGPRGATVSTGKAHRNFKHPRKARRPGRDPPGRDVCGSKIVTAVPIRTASPLPPGLVWP